jgi:hypothetical protein
MGGYEPKRNLDGGWESALRERTCEYSIFFLESIKGDGKIEILKKRR